MIPKRPSPLHCECGKVSYPRKFDIICKHCGRHYLFAKYLNRVESSAKATIGGDSIHTVVLDEVDNYPPTK